MNFMDTSYDPRYLAGIVLFNRGDYFEAHEVWEDLWMETAGPEKRYFQALIQAAVCLCHFCNGNLRGAAKLYRSSFDYMARFGPNYLGLDVTAFWQQMERCCDEVLKGDLSRRVQPVDELLPSITLEPAPQDWPDPALFLAEDDQPGGHS
jgi:predicted metal-dependent hydrolase